MEAEILMKAGDQELEGLLEINSREKGVVITHPHPLYGGDMFSPVVEAIRVSYRETGYTTLRFNFRGVGNSGGKHDEGIGEQEDVRSALAYLRAQEIKSLDLAGYSFGTYVNAEAVRNGAVAEGMLMVSPPVAFVKFSEPLQLPHLHLVVTGSRDEYAPPALLSEILPRWSPEARLAVIKGADHFYGGYMAELQSLLLAEL